MAAGESSREGLCSASLKFQRSKKRHFLASWKTEFPWVTFDHTVGMRCKYCMDTGKNSAFIKGCDKFKKTLGPSMHLL